MKEFKLNTYMSREIKFRGYWKGVNQMEYFSEAQYAYSKDGKIGMFLPAKDKKVYLGDSIDMQSIGLQDKNGNDIYEGDIFKYTHHKGYTYSSFISYIDWSEEYAGFGYWANNKINLFSIHDELKEDILNHLEVIGNIYQNPELLK